jgi:hypothetical protein
MESFKETEEHEIPRLVENPLKLAISRLVDFAPNCGRAVQLSAPNTCAIFPWTIRGRF